MEEQRIDTRRKPADTVSGDEEDWEEWVEDDDVDGDGRVNDVGKAAYGVSDDDAEDWVLDDDDDGWVLDDNGLEINAEDSGSKPHIPWYRRMVHLDLDLDRVRQSMDDVEDVWDGNDTVSARLQHEARREANAELEAIEAEIRKEIDALDWEMAEQVAEEEKAREIYEHEILPLYDPTPMAASLETALQGSVPKSELNRAIQQMSDDEATLTQTLSLSKTNTDPNYDKKPNPNPNPKDFTEVEVARFTSCAIPQAVNGRLDSTLGFSGSCGW